jgi:hypothetical protein
VGHGWLLRWWFWVKPQFAVTLLVLGKPDSQCPF